MLGRRAAGIGAATLLAIAGFIGTATTATAANPQVTITAGPTVNADNNVSLTYRINRQSRAIASRSCTADTATTSTSVDCGRLPVAKKSPTVVNVTVPDLADGTYTFTVRVALTDGGRGTATSAPFTVESSTCWDDTDGIDFDLRYDGPINTLDNIVDTSSTNGTCSPPDGILRTVVQAPDGALTANALCQSLGLQGAMQTLNYYGFTTAPADFWVCSRV